MGVQVSLTVQVRRCKSSVQKFKLNNNVCCLIAASANAYVFFPLGAGVRSAGDMAPTRSETVLDERSGNVFAFAHSMSLSFFPIGAGVRRCQEAAGPERQWE